jgi:hypothetical protein
MDKPNRQDLELSLFRAFLAAIHHIVIICRKIIDWTAIFLPFALWHHIKVNCLARSLLGRSNLVKSLCALYEPFTRFLRVFECDRGVTPMKSDRQLPLAY